MKRSFQLPLFCFTCLFVLCSFSALKAQHRQYIELRVYHVADSQQLGALNRFLQTAYVPALHRKGINSVGVFTQIGNDTASDKKIYVLTPFSSLNEMAAVSKKLDKDAQYQKDGAAYLDAAHDKAPYNRFETILLQAFEFMPKVAVPALTGVKSNRVYELRSYEGPTEKLYKNKVHMFNQGGEIDLFKRLGFNAVFYGEVLVGSKMPNLMYMTSFEDKKSRDEHWKTFGNDPFWKKLAAMPAYQHNVSKIDIVFLTPAEYSDL